MKAALHTFVSLSLALSGALFLSSTASADEPTHRYTAGLLDAMTASPAAEEIAPKASGLLPLKLEDEIELRDAHLITITEFMPQGRLSQKPPFFDFSKLELGGFAGIVAYSSDFDADPAPVAGIKARLPVPGIPLGEWGLWAEFLVSHIDRDLPFYYQNRGDIWFGFGAGADFTFVRERLWFLRAQVGILYANWNNVQALDNGIGILVGAQVGWYWIKGNDKAVLDFGPQLSYDGKNWIGFLSIGFSVDF